MILDIYILRNIEIDVLYLYTLCIKNKMLHIYSDNNNGHTTIDISYFDFYTDFFRGDV